MVNCLCVSGLLVVIDVVCVISCGEGWLYLVGGVESMFWVLFVMGKVESVFSCMLEVFDSIIGVCFVNFRLVECYGNDSMLEIGDNVVCVFGIVCEDVDCFVVFF